MTGGPGPAEVETVAAVLGSTRATRAVQSLAVALFVVLTGTAVATLGRSLWARRRDRRRGALEDDLRAALVERLERGDAAVATWADGLSDRERDVIVDIVEDHLELVAGRDRDALLALAEALDVERRCRSAIASGTRYERLRALRRLAVLGRTVEADWLLPRLSGTRQEREAAARVVAVESDSDRRAVVEHLLAGGPLTVFGLDALHGVVEADPAPLLRWLAEAEPEDDALLAQALFVLDRVAPVAVDAPLVGVVDHLDHDDPRVRAAARLVLAAYGYREDVRAAVDVADLTGDPSPRVRVATYRMLDSWGDPASRDHLGAALNEETDDRARLVLAAALHRSPPGTVARFFPNDPEVEELANWTAVETALVRRSDPLL